MKVLKYSLMVAVISFMLGCGHGYEGEYVAIMGSSNEPVNAYIGNMGDHNIIIGADYMEDEGARSEYDKVFVRKSGKESYLVFKNEEFEEAWKIIDKNTLLQGNDLIHVRLVRVK
ncbi:hypothetical protein [Rheinheimera salexigens]|uniref:Uncharacterized protein n=1 Tax=Rheinheimera salexigens TaxID=1628148 RepID=A0A1E7Q8K1_9GAMM|nr:hypothetical protein [Rheinheimera salexigens]OEY70467.1 hypothetical protein BI198_13495 [Rheinheimera salexigens]